MRTLATGALVIGLAGCSSATGPYPAREIKLIVQASPGGISDTVSRVIASRMDRQLGVPVGYTFGHGPVEIAMVRTLGFADVGPRDMELLCLVSKTQPALAVQAEAPWRRFAEFVDAVRARPGYYVVANSGTGSI